MENASQNNAEKDPSDQAIGRRRDGQATKCCVQLSGRQTLFWSKRSAPMSYPAIRSTSKRTVHSSARLDQMIGRISCPLLWLLVTLWLALPIRAQTTQDKVPHVSATTVVPFRTVRDQILKLDLYFPGVPTDGAKLPAVIMIHGGGWSSGDRSGLAREASMFARHGYVVLVPDYRLSGTATFPAALQDITAAFSWCLTHAREVNVDRSRIGVFGASAGGQLALLLAFAGQDADLARVAELPSNAPAVRAVCSWFGPSDLLAAGSDVRSVSSNTRQLVLQYMGGPPSTRHRHYTMASPVYHVHPGAPPVLLVHGDSDEVVPVSQSEILAEKLTAEHVPNKFIRVESAGHWFARGWFGLRPITPSTGDVYRATLAFFDNLLK